MAVRLNAGNDAIGAYVKEQAALGRDHVVALTKTEAGALMAGVADFSEEQGSIAAPGEYSALQVFQHLDGSVERSLDRLTKLSKGQPWTPPANPPAPSTEASYSKAKQIFADTTASVVAVLEQADPSMVGTVTATHPDLGELNWLEWAVYTHHVHVHDHVGQIGEIRAVVRKWALPSGQIKIG